MDYSKCKIPRNAVFIGSGSYGLIYEVGKIIYKQFSGLLEESFKNCLIEGIHYRFLKNIRDITHPLKISYRDRIIKFPLGKSDLRILVNYIKCIRDNEITIPLGIGSLSSGDSNSSNSGEHPSNLLEEKIKALSLQEQESNNEINQSEVQIDQDLSDFVILDEAREISPPLEKSSPEKILLSDLQISCWSIRNFRQLFLILLSIIFDFHCHNFVHLDLSKTNVIQMNDNSYRIIDFGTSRVNFSSKLMHYDRSKTTIPYRAPEILLGMPYDEKADIWSLGVLFYEIFYGDFLFGYNQSKLTMLMNIDEITLELGKLKSEYVDEEGKIYHFRKTILVPPDDPFENLIYNMTRPNLTERYNIIDVLRHPYFKDLITEKEFLTEIWAADKLQFIPQILLSDPSEESFISSRELLRRLKLITIENCDYYPGNPYIQSFQGSFEDDEENIEPKYIFFDHRRVVFFKLLKLCAKFDYPNYIVYHTIYLLDTIIYQGIIDMKIDNLVFITSCCMYLAILLTFDDRITLEEIKSYFNIGYSDHYYIETICSIVETIDDKFFISRPSDFLKNTGFVFEQLEMIASYLGLPFYYSAKLLSIALDTMTEGIKEDNFLESVSEDEKSKIAKIVKQLQEYIIRSPETSKKYFMLGEHTQKILTYKYCPTSIKIPI